MVRAAFQVERVRHAAPSGPFGSPRHGCSMSALAKRVSAVHDERRQVLHAAQPSRLLDGREQLAHREVIRTAASVSSFTAAGGCGRRAAPYPRGRDRRARRPNRARAPDPATPSESPASSTSRTGAGTPPRRALRAAAVREPRRCRGPGRPRTDRCTVTPSRSRTASSRRRLTRDLRIAGCAKRMRIFCRASTMSPGWETAARRLQIPSRFSGRRITHRPARPDPDSRPHPESGGCRWDRWW